MMLNENYQDLILMDPSQLQLLEQYDKTELLILDSPSEEEALHTLSKQLKHNLSRLKKSILVVEQSDNCAKILQHLARLKISKYCIELSHLGKLTEKESNRLKLWCKRPTQKIFPIPLQSQINKTEKQKDQLKTSYQLITAPFFGEQNWLEMVDRAGVNASNYSHLYRLPKLENIDLEYSPSEYWHLKGRIQKLANNFNSDYLEIEDNIGLDADVFQKNSIEDVLHSLKEFQQEARHLLKELHQYLEEYQLKHESIWRQKLHLIKKLIYDLSEAREELEWKENHSSVDLSNKLKNVFGSGSSILKKEKEKLNSILERIRKLLDEAGVEENLLIAGIDDVDLIQAEEFKTLISDWESHIEKWAEYQQLDMDRNISRMNKYNSSDKSLKEIEDRIEKLISLINAKALFSKTFEDHSLSSVKKLSFLRELLQFLDQCIVSLETKPAYTDWFNTLASLNDKMKRIYEMLVRIPTKDWLAAFDAWYFRKLVKQHSIINIPQDSRPLKDWHSSVEQIQQALDKFLGAIWLEKRLEAQEALKQSNKIIHVALFKKKHSPEFSWIDLFTAEAKSMSDIYPIILLDKETFQEFNMIQGSHWDQLIHFQSTATEHINFKLSKKLAAHHIINYKPEQKEQVLSHKLLKDAPVVKLLETLSHAGAAGLGDRLRKSREMAMHLKQAGGKCRIFQLKHVLIISYLSPLKNQLIISSLKDAGIKELSPMEDVELILQESLIDRERKWVVFTQDGLLNLMDLKHLGWQLHLLKVLKEEGAQIFPIWSLQNMDHWGSKIFKSCQLILAMNGETESKAEETQIANG